MKKRIISLGITAAVSISLFSSCSMMQQKQSALNEYDFANMNLVQLEEPKEGQDVAIIETSLGKMTLVLYPEYAPNIVNNFKARVNEGFYNGKPFFAIENKYYALTGASNDEGTDGITDDGQLIEDEYSENLWPYKGSLLSYSGKAGFGDSRFFICGAREISTNDIDELKSYKNEDGSQMIPDKLIDSFVEKGSVPGFAGMYSIYGQMINGFDVLDEILAAKVSDETKKPEKDILITKITLTTYKKGDFVLETPKVPDLVISETSAETNESGQTITKEQTSSESTSDANTTSAD